jgi:hypothetical protein
MRRNALRLLTPYALSRLRNCISSGLEVAATKLGLPVAGDRIGNIAVKPEPI